MTTDGSSLVIWRSDDPVGGHDGLFGQWYDSNGTATGGEFAVPYQGPEPGTYALTFAGNGSFILVQTGPDTDGTGIFAQRYSGMGSPVGPYFQVNTNAVDQQIRPAAAMAPDGRFVVVWQCEFPADSSIYGQRFSSAGTPDGGEILVSPSSYSQSRPAVAMAPDGSFVVAWSSWDQDGSSYGVFAQRFDAQGNPLGRGP
ncbi:hypothetical protein ACFL51_01465 [Myxococcota bacterium]